MSQPPCSNYSGPGMETPEGFDIDEAELVELYKRIPPPDLRGHALAVSRDKVVSDVVRKVKEDGVFDSFRKNWLKDLETKPQFQNLVRRVEIRCAEFLADHKWSPQMNRTHMREQLQQFVEKKLGFVDVGIRDLLQEVHTGHYSNPIPAQRYEEAVTRIVGEMVQKCVETSTPDFPRLRRVDADQEQSSSAGFEMSTEPLVFLEENDTIMKAEDGPRRERGLSSSKSPDVVDMEISSPENSNIDTEEDGRSCGLPQNPNEEPRRQMSVEPDSDPLFRPKLSGDAGASVTDENDRVQGAALGLLLLASGSGSEWNDFDEEVKEEPADTFDGAESSAAEDPFKAETKAVVLIKPQNHPEARRNSEEKRYERSIVKDGVSDVAVAENRSDIFKNGFDLTLLLETAKMGNNEIPEGTLVAKDEECLPPDVPRSVDKVSTIPDSKRTPPSVKLKESVEIHPENPVVEIEQIKPEDPVPAPGGSMDSPARPTRQRKSNKRYCNDAFVTTPPLQKRRNTAV